MSSADSKVYLGDRSLGLEYDARIRVRCAERDQLQWLANFLTPQFQIVDESSCDYDVDLVIDPERYEALRSNTPLHDRRAVAFAFESTLVELPLWKAAHGEIVMFDEMCRVFCGANREGRAVTLTAAAADLLVRFAVMRVVRELAMNEARRRGRLLLHAAALEVGGRAVAIAGAKGAGKTTTLISLLRQPGTRYVTNDRAVVDTSTDPLRLRGMPTIVTIRPAMLGLFPALGQRLRAGTYDLPWDIDPAFLKQLVASRAFSERFTLTPPQFCALTGVDAVGCATVSSVVFPRVVPELNGWRVETLTPARAAERLRASLLEGYFRVSSDLFGGPPAPAGADAERQIRDVASRVCCFELLLGGSVHASESFPEDVLAMVL